MKSIGDITRLELAGFISIDLKEIERRSKVEGKSREFNDIKAQLAKAWRVV